MIVEEYLNQAEPKEIEALLHDVEILHKTGMLSLDSPLRRLAEKFLGSSNVLEMTAIAYNVYRHVAINKERK